MRPTALLLLITACAAQAPLGAGEASRRELLEQRWLLEIDPAYKPKLIGAVSQPRGEVPWKDASGAVNGDRFDGIGFHTLEEQRPWWVVDLQQVRELERVVLYNREGAESRERFIEVLLSTDAKVWDAVYTHDGTTFYGGVKGTRPLDLDFTGKKARYIRLQVRDTFLHLNEVEVFARDDPTANIALHKPATQSSSGPWSKAWLESPVKLEVSIPKPPPRKEVTTRVFASMAQISDMLALTAKTIAYVDAAGVPCPGATAALRALEVRAAEPELPDAARNALYFQVRHVRRETLFRHPDLSFERVLINQAPAPAYSHNGDQHLGRHSRPGPGLTLLANWKAEPVPTPFLTEKLPKGVARSPDLHYDAQRVVFAYCDHERTADANQRRYFLYEAALDGSWVRQLTGTPHDTLATWNDRCTVLIEDNDPCYLPDDHIAFISTRSQSYGRCHGGRYNPAWVLHRCGSDGTHIRQLSFGNENEYEPSVLNDGRIVFTRWEYTNRHEMLFHMLWWCRADGTGVANFYGNDTLHPMMVVEASAIPGTHKIVATAQGHHSYNTGTSVIIDTNIGDNGEAPVTRLTPETPYSETQGWPRPHFSHPYAINGELFLVSRANHPVHSQGRVPPENDRAIYLVDLLGGREFIYENAAVASFSPIAVRPRKRPPVLADRLGPNAAHGTLFLQNAYLTRNDPEGKIKPGMIKAIRVNALGVQPRRQRTAISATVGVELPKRVVGTVPVNEDGSAFCKVPAGTAIQLQTLDANGMALLTQKSFFYLQPGESRSCVGCHEPSGTAPAPAATPGTPRRHPVDLAPPAGPSAPWGMTFKRNVQPVLDRYCISCHGLDGKAAEISLIADPGIYPESMKALIRRGQHWVGLKSLMWDRDEQYNVSRPMRFYAHSNTVAHMLTGNADKASPELIRIHHDQLTMDDRSRLRIIEWLDLNAQACGDLFPNKVEERRLNGGEFANLREVVKGWFGEKLAAQPGLALVNPVVPEESRILMAPLPRTAGGWGQIKGYADRNDPTFITMTKLVHACISRRANENTRGWEPTRDMGGGDEWFVESRRNLRAELAARQQ